MDQRTDKEKNQFGEVNLDEGAPSHAGAGAIPENIEQALLGEKSEFSDQVVSQIIAKYLDELK